LDQGVIPMPLFAGSNQLEVLSLTDTQTYAIQGQCDHRIQSLSAAATGAANATNLQSMTTGGLNVTCAQDGQFSFTLKSLTDLGFAPQDNGTYTIQLFAVTRAGNSNPSTIRIVYSKEGGTGPKRILITSGSTQTSRSPVIARQAASTSFRAEIRVDHQLNHYTTPTSADSMLVKTSPSFKMKLGPASSND
jgi:hypothetical protein